MEESNKETKAFKGKALYKPTGKAGEYSEWACNFFTGCSHDCSYCYCKRGVMSHVWSDKPKLKKCFKDADDAISVFEKELMANIGEVRKHGIFFSFTTDPMIPRMTLELTIKAMRKALMKGVPVQILTKRADWWYDARWKSLCDNVIEDFTDMIAIGFTLTGRDDLEPGADTNEDRIEAMRKCKSFGFHTFASIEPIVNLDLSEKMMEKALPFCDLFKVGLMSNGAKPEKKDLIRMVDMWNHYLAKLGKKVYWKQSVVDYLGDDFTSNLDSCVGADYNIFSD